MSTVRSAASMRSTCSAIAANARASASRVLAANGDRVAVGEPPASRARGKRAGSVFTQPGA